MNGAAFALVLMASGYVVLRYTPFTRPHIFRTDGHALYFLVVAAALVMAAVSALMLHEISAIPMVGEVLRTSLFRLLKVFGTDAGAMTLGSVAASSIPFSIVIAKALELPLRYSPSLRARLLISLSSIGELEEFLWKTAAKQLPVMLTMSSGKVYIGSSIDTASLRDDRRWIRFEPLLSGYRDERHQFQPVTSYAWLHGEPAPHEHILLEDFDVLLPFDEVSSVHGFDLPSYAQGFRHAPVSPSFNAGGSARSPSPGIPKAVNLYFGYAGILLMLPLTSFLGGALALAGMTSLAVLLAWASAIPEEP